MKIIFSESLGGVSCINKFSKEKDYKSLLLLFKGLLEDTEYTLQVSDVKPFKHIKPRIYQIRKKDFRIFYMLEDDKLIILDIFIKKKNHTQKQILDRVKKRAKQI